jgi:hypothetical protein
MRARPRFGWAEQGCWGPGSGRAWTGHRAQELAVCGCARCWQTTPSYVAPKWLLAPCQCSLLGLAGKSVDVCQESAERCLLLASGTGDH